jgi:hypothetical protein
MFFWLILACEPPPAFRNPAPAGCREVTGEQCYWMDNGPGEVCWIPMSGASREECQARDSCTGGGGTSNGGCYKWARCSTCAADPWK